MRHVAVKSTNIASLGYDALTKELQVTFKDKDDKPTSTYSYADVPEDVALSLRHASSVGKYFGDNVRGKFATAKLAEPVTVDNEVAW